MNEAIYVVFETQKDRLNAEDVKKLISFMHSYSEKNKDKNCSDLLNCIIVIKGSATALGRKALDTYAPYVFESFIQEELLVNITHHMLVPTHSVISDAEKAELLKRYRAKENQLPKIQCEDPVAKYFGVRRGQVMKIVRPSETAGRYVTYRLAV